MRIIVTDTAMHVNHALPYFSTLEPRKLCVVKLDSCSDDINPDFGIVDVSADKVYMDLTKTGYDSWQYQCIQNHADEIVEKFTSHGYHGHIWYEDVMILGDLNPETLYVLDVLQKSQYDADIHLILPIPYGRTEKGTMLHSILSDLSKVRTLAVYDPYEFVEKKYGNMDADTVEKIIVEQTELLCDRFREQLGKMAYQSSSTKYFFDFEKDSYIDTDELYILDDYKMMHTLGLLVDPYLRYQDKEENDYAIECFLKPVPRPDGKLICEKLRAIRKEFARLNGIDFTFKECTYNGPCAGTCKACDEEAKLLTKIAKKIGNVKYPKVDISSEEAIL